MRQFTQQGYNFWVVVLFTVVGVFCSARSDIHDVSSASSSSSSASSSFLRSGIIEDASFRSHNSTVMSDPFAKLEAMREFRAQLQRERERQDRRKTAKQVYQKLPKAPQGHIERVSPEEWEIIDSTQKKRGLSWFGDGNSGSAYSNSILADPGAYYDKWAQAYRMIGGFIDCDHAKSANSHDNGNNNNNNNANNGACSRWMMWAAVSVCPNQEYRLCCFTVVQPANTCC